MQTCGADPGGVRVDWRDGGGGTRLVGVTELGRMMALSVPEGLGRWDSGECGGHGPAAQGLG